MSQNNPLEPEISDVASLKQAVEWVAFGELPLTDSYNTNLRSEGSIWLRSADPESLRTQAVCDAQEKLFIVLRKGFLTATTYIVDEIEIANYDQDTPYFRFIRNPNAKKKSFKPQEINNTLWNLNSIFWSDSSLIYNKEDISRGTWTLAQIIRVETSKLLEIFPKKDNPDNKKDFKTHTGDAGRPSAAHLYLEEFKRRVSKGNVETTLAKQARSLLDWLVSSHPEHARPSVGTIQNRLRTPYRHVKNPTK